MQAEMLTMRHELQIREAIVGPIARLVMDDFMLGKRPSEVLFHNPTMFEYFAPIGQAQSDVSRIRQSAFPFPQRRLRADFAFVDATSGTVPALSDTHARGECPEFFAACGTDTQNLGRLLAHRSLSLRCRAGAVDAAPGTSISSPQFYQKPHADAEIGMLGNTGSENLDDLKQRYPTPSRRSHRASPIPNAELTGR